MSANVPDWLPEIIPFDGDWDDYLRQLYAIFESDFKNTSLQHAGRRVWYDSRSGDDDRHSFEEGFWHLTTKDEIINDHARRTKRKERVPDFRRAERLTWCRAVIQHASDPAVLCWTYEEEFGQVREYLWLKEHDYVVILRPWQTRKFGAVWMITTAYHLDYPNAKANLLSKYEARK